MKVGILTQPLKGNYGGIIQNWALQQAIIKIGHDPITIDYMFSDTISMWVKVNISRILSWIANPHNGLSYYAKNVVRTQIFDDFIKENICTTDTVHHYSQELIHEYQLDALIVGSDQVWRPMYNDKTLYDMFCEFSLNTNIKRISYAASFGTDNWEYSDSQTEVCRKLVHIFNCVSVREKSAIELCKNHLDVEAVQVLDPTFLLNKNEYNCLISNIEPLFQKSFLAAYILDPTDAKLNYIGEVARQKKLTPLIVFASSSATLTPKQWISIFRDAEYVITDSFHGSAFSLIFEKPFETLGNKMRGNARFKLINDLKENSNINFLREKSIHWLENALQPAEN